MNEVRVSLFVIKARILVTSVLAVLRLSLCVLFTGLSL